MHSIVCRKDRNGATPSQWFPEVPWFFARDNGRGIASPFEFTKPWRNCRPTSKMRSRAVFRKTDRGCLVPVRARQLFVVLGDLPCKRIGVASTHKIRVEKLKSSGQRAANHSYQLRKTKPDKARGPPKLSSSNRAAIGFRAVMTAYVSRFSSQWMDDPLGFRTPPSSGPPLGAGKRWQYRACWPSGRPPVHPAEWSDLTRRRGTGRRLRTSFEWF